MKRSSGGWIFSHKEINIYFLKAVAFLFRAEPEDGESLAESDDAGDECQDALYDKYDAHPSTFITREVQPE